MKRLFAMLLLFLVFTPLAWATPATMHYRDQQIQVWLFPAACTSPSVVWLIMIEKVPLYREASVLWKGKTYAACWRLTEDKDLVFLVDETNEYAFLPLSVFKPEIGV